MHRVVERADHARQVAQRRPLHAAVLYGSPGPAVEIADDEVLAGVEQAGEVVVAVQADAQAPDRGVQHAVEAIDDRGLEREQSGGRFARRFGQTALRAFQSAEDLADQVPHLLVDRTLIEFVERLGGEGRERGGARERGVHLSGSTT